MSNASATQGRASIAGLDALLAQSPFGSSDYLTEQMHVAFKRRLGKIAVHMPPAAQLADALDRADSHAQYRVLGDMVVRCAIQHALKQLETGDHWGLPLDMCEEIFSATWRQVEAGEYGPLGSRLHDRLGPEPHHGWIWSADRRDDVFARAFREVVGDNYGEQPGSTTPEEAAMLVKGTELVQELLPHSSRSALSHVHLVAVFSPAGAWASRSSSSEYRLSGTVFLSHRLLANHWWVAEHLFHEALHQQLYDLRQGHSLLIPDFDRAGCPTICSLWNVPDSTGNNLWDVHRSLAAFHVYVCLGLLSTLAEERAEELEAVYGRQSTNARMVPSGTAFARAHYLGEQMKTSFWNELGPAGKQLVEWFSSVLDVLDPSPPPPGSYVHLMLDRYWREAREVVFVEREPEAPHPFSDRLVTLARTEVDSARGALRAVNATEELRRFDEAVAGVLDGERFTAVPDDDPGRQFARVRGMVIRALMNVSPNGYTLANDQAPEASDQIVREMVEQSSETLTTLVGR
jgi:hypothetical protein